MKRKIVALPRFTSLILALLVISFLTTQVLAQAGVAYIGYAGPDDLYKIVLTNPHTGIVDGKQMLHVNLHLDEKVNIYNYEEIYNFHIGWHAKIPYIVYCLIVVESHTGWKYEKCGTKGERSHNMNEVNNAVFDKVEEKIGYQAFSEINSELGQELGAIRDSWFPGVLAVTLNQFIASQMNINKIKVYWSTGWEMGASHFEVYRGTTSTFNLNNVDLVQTVDAVGNEFGAEYTVYDQQFPQADKLYYWLLEIETNGDGNLYGPSSLQPISGPGDPPPPR